MNNKKLYIGIAALLTAILVFIPMTGVRASAETAVPLAKTSKAALLVDADTGSVVFSKNEHDRLQIASMVKIMTLSLAFDEIERRGIPFDTMVTASERAASMGGSQAFLDAGSQYKLEELLKSIVVASANDSCVAVAEQLFGSVEAFVAAMNDRAATLGLNDTRFVNCTGLPQEGQYSTAADVAVMFRELIRHPRFFEYAGVWMYDFVHPSGRVTGLTNTNKLIRFFEGCDGGKTGYTDKARSCVTVTAKRGDTRLICVAIGAESSKTRNREVSEMLNYGFSNYKTIYALKAGDIVGDINVSGGKVNKIPAVAESDVTAFVKSGEKPDISLKCDIGGVTAPITAGERVGTISVLIDGSEYKTVCALAAESCDKKGYGDILDDFISEW